MFGLSLWELGIILLIVVLIFGTKKLRNIGSDAGGAVKDFKDAMRDDTAKKVQAEDKGDNNKDDA